MMRNRDIRQLQEILLIRRFVVYLLVLKYVQTNKLMSSTGAKAFNFTYDNNGNTISENQKTYIYNQNQRLIKVTDTRSDTAVLGEYLYNANGQRVKKTTTGRTTYFIYDQSGNMIGEYDEQGQVNSDYIYRGSLPISRIDEWWEGMQLPQEPTGLNLIPGDKQLSVSWNESPAPVDGYKVHWGTESKNYTNSTDVGKTTSYAITGLTNGTTYYVAVTAYADLKETYFYHVDHLGTPILMTNGNGTIVWEGELLPFGERYSVKGKVSNNIGFPGQFYDTETGLYYNWHRYDDSKIGRFTTHDPSLHLRGSPEIPYLLPAFFRTPQKLNPYNFALNNPIRFVDPLGLSTTATYYFYAGGTLNEDMDFEANLGQAVIIDVKNVNVLGTTISIKSNLDGSYQLIIAPQQQKEFKFTTFGCEPLNWKFSISSVSDAFIVTYVIKSTWVPGMPSNQ